MVRVFVYVWLYLRRDFYPLTVGLSECFKVLANNPVLSNIARDSGAERPMFWSTIGIFASPTKECVSSIFFL